MKYTKNKGVCKTNRWIEQDINAREIALLCSKEGVSLPVISYNLGDNHFLITVSCFNILSSASCNSSSQLSELMLKNPMIHHT